MKGKIYYYIAKVNIYLGKITRKQTSIGIKIPYRIFKTV